jgi:transposase
MQDYRRARQQVSSFLLRHGRSYEGTTWTKKHRLWLAAQTFAHVSQTLAFEELLRRIERAQAFLAEMDKAIAATVSAWSLKPVVEALQALRGVSLLTAATLVAEVGDFRRFNNPRDLMGYLGLVPGERSSGATTRRGGITKTGNTAARTALIEAAWSYRHPARIGKTILARQHGRTPRVTTIAWNAQKRLCARYRRLVAGGKAPPKAVVAVARELVGFVWAIARDVDTHAASPQQVTPAAPR